MEKVSYILSGHFSQFIIIYADKAGIEIGGGLTVDDYYGDAPVIGFFYNRGQGLRLVGRYQQDIDVLVEEFLYLFDLQFAVVIAPTVYNLARRPHAQFPAHTFP